jgi:predicted 3-demethylubiquinone-9 3-methyltransferase (glyoxalase superfamily)
MNFYVGIFKNSKVVAVDRYEKAEGETEDAVLSATIELGGHQFKLLEGGPMYQFSPATSFVVRCETQEEVDY